MFVVQRITDQAIYPDFQSNALPGVVLQNAINANFGTVDTLHEINIDSTTFTNYQNAAYGALEVASLTAINNLKTTVTSQVTPLVGTSVTALTAAQQLKAIIICLYLLNVIDVNAKIAPLAQWLPS